MLSGLVHRLPWELDPKKQKQMCLPQIWAVFCCFFSKGVLTILASPKANFQKGALKKKVKK